MASKRVLIVGGVAGGASCAARLRRMDENAEIFIFERERRRFLRQLRPAVLSRRRDRRSAAAFRRHARAVPRLLQRRGPHLARGPPHRPRQPDHRGAKPPDGRGGQRAVRRAGAFDRGRAGAAAAAGRRSARHLHPPRPRRHRPDPRWIGHRKANRAVVVGAGYIGLEMAENLSPPRHRRHPAGIDRPGHAAGRPRNGRADPAGTGAAGRRSAARQRRGRASSRGRTTPITVVAQGMASGSPPRW